MNVEFLARSYKHKYHPEKSKVRYDLLCNVLDGVPLNIPHVRMLTLPGAFWHFERPLLEAWRRVIQPGDEEARKKDRRHQKLSIKSVESCTRTFSIATQRLPMVGEQGIKTSYDPLLDCQFVHNYRNITFFNCNLHRFIERTNWIFNVAWFDLCSPYSDHVASMVENISPLLSTKWAMFALTVMRGRESLDTVVKMRKAKTREEFIVEECLGHLGPAWNFMKCTRYQDGAPMVQLLFSRNQEESYGNNDENARESVRETDAGQEEA